MNVPGSLADDDQRIEDVPNFSWVLHRKGIPQYNFFLLMCIFKETVAANDYYDAFSLIVIDQVCYPYKYQLLVTPNPSDCNEILCGKVSSGSSKCSGSYIFSSAGTSGTPPTDLDQSDLMNYIYFHNLHYNWFKKLNEKNYFLRNDISNMFAAKKGDPSVSGFPAGSTALFYQNKLQDIYKKASLKSNQASLSYDLVENSPIDKAFDESYESDEGGFIPTEGVDATQFDNMFLNTPRNADVCKIVTEYVWRQIPRTRFRVVVWQCDTPVSLYKTFGFSVPFEPTGGTPLNITTLICDNIGKYIQYHDEDRSEFVASEFMMMEARDMLRQIKASLYGMFQLFVDKIVTMWELQGYPNLYQYVWGESTLGNMIVSNLVDYAEELTDPNPPSVTTGIGTYDPQPYHGLQKGLAWLIKILSGK